MKSLGTHVLMEYYNCSEQALDNVKLLEALMLNAAKKAEATIIKSVFHEFSPQGVTGVVVVAESHLAIHTWPEHGYAAVDFFTCNDQMRYDLAHELIAHGLQAEETEMKTIKRGTQVQEPLLNE